MKQRPRKSKDATDDRQSLQLPLSPEYRPQSPGLDEEKAGKERQLEIDGKVDAVAEGEIGRI